MATAQFNPTRSLPFAFDELDPSVQTEFVPLRASDGGDVFGVLYSPKGARVRTCFLAVHPRGDYTRFYATPGVVAQGFGMLCLTTRYLNNDSDAQHERMLLDLAAAMRALRDRGIEQVVLFGNSGGGSLTTFYAAQAALDPDQRLERTPAGDRVDLANEDMPLAAGQCQVAVHVGEGHFMAHVIDPSVVDEGLPMATDSTLDMYDCRNGRNAFPEPSSYDSAWLDSYRAAQEVRCARIDAIAQSLVDERRQLRASVDRSALTHSPHVERATLFARYMLVYRTLANPFYLDPSIDPSDRHVGSSFTPGLDPIVGNYGLHGLGRVLTPRAWLSTWSSTFTQSGMTRNLRGFDMPSLFINATGDTEIGPTEFAEIVDACPAGDRIVATVRADHYLRPLDEDDPDPRAELDQTIAEWASARFAN